MNHMCRSEALLRPPERLSIFVHTEEVGSNVRNDTGRNLHCSDLASLSVSRTIAPDVTYEDLSK